MKKLLTVLLILSLFSGCQKKEDITYECTLYDESRLIVDIIVVDHNYKTVKENYTTLSFVEYNEEGAKTLAELLQTIYPEATVTVNGNHVDAIIDFMGGTTSETSEELFNGFITAKETDGFICEIKK